MLQSRFKTGSNNVIKTYLNYPCVQTYIILLRLLRLALISAFVHTLVSKYEINPNNSGKTNIEDTTWYFYYNSSRFNILESPFLVFFSLQFPPTSSSLIKIIMKGFLR